MQRYGEMRGEEVEVWRVWGTFQVFYWVPAELSSEHIGKLCHLVWKGCNVLFLHSDWLNISFLLVTNWLK